MQVLYNFQDTPEYMPNSCLRALIFWQHFNCIPNVLPNDTRARLGRVIPLGRPRSVYKSNVESSFLSQNDGQMTLKVKDNYSHIQHQLS